MRWFLVYGTALGFFGQGVVGAEGVGSGVALNQPPFLFNDTLVPPPDFKVEIDADKEVPLIMDAVYRTAVNMMYDITSFPLSYPWMARDWTSSSGGAPPRGNLGFHVEHKDFGGKEPSRLSTQYVLWGLNHLMIAMYVSGMSCQTIAILRWQGTPVGVIYVAQTQSYPPITDSQTSNSTDALELAIQQLRGSAKPNLHNEDVEVSVRYRENVPIEKQLIYLTAIKAMSDAAEIGLERPVLGVFTQGLRKVHWKLGNAGTQAFTGVFKPAYSRIAVIKTLAAMIEDKQFQAIDVWIKVGGKSTGIGGFGRG